VENTTLPLLYQSEGLWDFATNGSCAESAPPHMKIAHFMHFVYIKRFSGEYHCEDEPLFPLQKTQAVANE
jgi:hypothetical protein